MSPLFTWLVCPALANKPTPNTPIHIYDLKLSSYNRYIGAQVKLSCYGNRIPNGAVSLRCMPGGKWNDTIPECVDRYKKHVVESDPSTLITAGTAIILSTTFVACILCLVYYFYFKRSLKASLNKSPPNADTSFQVHTASHRGSIKTPSLQSHAVYARVWRPCPSVNPYSTGTSVNNIIKTQLPGQSYMNYDDLNYVEEVRKGSSKSSFGNRFYPGKPSYEPREILWPQKNIHRDDRSRSQHNSALGRLPRFIAEENGMFRGTWRPMPLPRKNTFNF